MILWSILYDHICKKRPLLLKYITKQFSIHTAAMYTQPNIFDGFY